MISLREVPLSGDRLLDWVFKQFIVFLNRKTVYIIRKKRLKKANSPREGILLGLTMPKNPKNYLKGTYIFINSAKCRHHDRNEETETLIHELCHNLFSDSKHRFINQLERMLIEDFTNDQKKILKSFIPHHEIKT